MKTINKSVQVEKFTDSLPIADRRNPFGGLSVTATKLDGSLFCLPLLPWIFMQYFVNIQLYFWGLQFQAIKDDNKDISLYIDSHTKFVSGKLGK